MEFASITPDHYEEALLEWKFSGDERDMMRGDDPDLNISPTPIITRRARAAHRAARIWKHIEWSTQACTQYKQWQDEVAAAINKAELN